MEHLSVEYRKKALPRSLTVRVLMSQQRKIYERYVRNFPPRVGERILDLGIDASLEQPERYFFEHAYPHTSQIVAAGLEGPSNFTACYPEASYVQVRRGEALPFDDGQFDVVFCSAVIEHVGNREAQKAFLDEVLRVARSAFITTPNRWHPIELHTTTPLLHWLPARVYRPLFRAMGFEFFSKEENLNLLDVRALRRLLGQREHARVERHWFLGFPSNLITIVTP